MNSNLISPEISVSALASLLEDLKQAGSELHSIVLYRDNVKKLSWSLFPHSQEEKREMYSVSKSFTSTAFGVAFDAGLIRPEDKLVRFFPEYRSLWEKDERWQQVTLHHVLTMAPGHSSCVMAGMANAPDAAAAFFSAPLSYAPGERFAYNTGATFMAGEAVRRVTGETVPEILARYVFPAIGIENFTWLNIRDGHCAAGVGLHISCEDLAKLGLLYFNRGMVGSRRILSEEWVEMATKAQIPNSDNGTPDWCAGYGYQFWRNARGGYRADGAFGQGCFVLPQKGIVCAFTSESKDLTAAFDRIQDFLEEPGKHFPEKTTLPEQFSLEEEWTGEPFDSQWRRLNPNPVGLTGLRLLREKDRATLYLGDGQGVQALKVIRGKWVENTLFARELKPSLYTFSDRSQPMEIRLSAAPVSAGEDFLLECRCLNCPHRFLLRVAFPGGKAVLTLESEFDVFSAEKKITEKESLGKAMCREALE